MTNEEIITELLHIKAWVEHWDVDRKFGLMPTSGSIDMVLVRLDELLTGLKEKVNG